MDTIFFEKQDGMLCAQHALNMLLQQQLFSAVDLAEIAHQLDRDENSVLGIHDQNAHSQNMDDSGFFSVQVISKALEPFTLDIIHIDHPSVFQFRNDPTNAQAYVCNQQQHWFVLRKFGEQWFSLNSVKDGPQLLSDTYLSIYIHQLRTEGYTIFLVNGVLPNCEADTVISLCPVVPEKRDISKLAPSIVPVSSGRRLGTTTDDITPSAVIPATSEEDDIAAAIALSLGKPIENRPVSPSDLQQGSSTDADLQAALLKSAADDQANDASLQAALAASRKEIESFDVQEQDRQLQLAMMHSLEENAHMNSDNTPALSGADRSTPVEAPILARSSPNGPTESAVTTEVSPETEDLRSKRAAFLDRLN